MDRRRLLNAGVALLAIAAAAPGAAHHGLMLWDEENLVTIEGFVSQELDGFPHWEIQVRVDDDSDDWLIDLGDNFTMERAGLHEDGREFSIGAAIKVEGFRPRDSETRLLRPARITIGGTVHEFPALDSFPKD